MRGSHPTKRRAQLETLTYTRFEFPVLSSRHQANSLRFSEPDYTWGEPVFVPRSDAGAEDDGLLRSLGHHTRRDQSVLAVLYARTLEPLARCRVSLPLGFHGSFRAAA